MDLIGGLLNNRLLDNLTVQHTPECSEVRAAIAYAGADKVEFFSACRALAKPVTYYGRYDESVPVAPELVKWFLDQRNPDYVCRMVPDILHAKVIWWVGVGAYIGSANLTGRAWISNIEAGTFLTEGQMESTAMMEELRQFFDVVEARAHPIDDRFYRHLLELRRLGVAVDRATSDLQEKFRAKRFFPEDRGLASFDLASAVDRAYVAFERDWREALQFLKDIAQTVATDQWRPSWIPGTVPAGAQADQFLHAYYYKVIQGNLGGDRVDKAFESNKGNRSEALQKALQWWKASNFDYEHEKRTLLEWAPRLKELLARDRLATLSREEFVEALSMVHAVIDYGSKRANSELGLPSIQQSRDLKVQLHVGQLWDERSNAGYDAKAVFHDVIWGAGPIERRVWRAARDHQWRLRWVQFSTLGELIGWARPDEYPPRNDRTLKGLRALGYPVRGV